MATTFRGLKEIWGTNGNDELESEVQVIHHGTEVFDHGISQGWTEPPSGVGSIVYGLGGDDYLDNVISEAFKTWQVLMGGPGNDVYNINGQSTTFIAEKGGDGDVDTVYTALHYDPPSGQSYATPTAVYTMDNRHLVAWDYNNSSMVIVPDAYKADFKVSLLDTYGNMMDPMSMSYAWKYLDWYDGYRGNFTYDQLSTLQENFNDYYAPERLAGGVLAVRTAQRYDGRSKL